MVDGINMVDLHIKMNKLNYKNFHLLNKEINNLDLHNFH